MVVCDPPRFLLVRVALYEEKVRARLSNRGPRQFVMIVHMIGNIGARWIGEVDSGRLRLWRCPHEANKLLRFDAIVFE